MRPAFVERVFDAGCRQASDFNRPSEGDLTVRHCHGDFSGQGAGGADQRRGIFR